MKLLIEIHENDVGILDSPKVKFSPRNAARAILFDKNNKIAILEVSKYGFHKIPGGGFKEGEDIKSAFRREVAEETGCKIEIGKPIGMSVEYKNQKKSSNFLLFFCLCHS